MFSLTVNIKNILGENCPEYKPFDTENEFISIYQSDGISIELLFETIKDKIEKGYFPNQPWMPISGNNGFWKIENTKVKN